MPNMPVFVRLWLQRSKMPLETDQGQEPWILCGSVHLFGSMYNTIYITAQRKKRTAEDSSSIHHVHGSAGSKDVKPPAREKSSDTRPVATLAPVSPFRKLRRPPASSTFVLPWRVYSSRT